MVEARTRDAELLRLLDAETPPWVVTPTRRLARDLVLRVARLRAEAGRRVSATPPIRALDDWMRVLGEEVLLHRAASGAGRVLLSPFAEQAIWEQVIVAERGEQMRQELGAATSAEARERLAAGGLKNLSEAELSLSLGMRIRGQTYELLVPIAAAIVFGESSASS